MQITLTNKDGYQLVGERTWSHVHEEKKKYTTTGWLVGIEVATMDEPVKKIDEFLLTITPSTLLVPPDLAMQLYNMHTSLKEFEGQTHVRTISEGMGNAGTRKEYKFEDGEHWIKTGLHELKWYKCTNEVMSYYFITENQYQIIQHVFGRIPGVMYI